MNRRSNATLLCLVSMVLAAAGLLPGRASADETAVDFIEHAAANPRMMIVSLLLLRLDVPLPGGCCVVAHTGI